MKIDIDKQIFDQRIKFEKSTNIENKIKMEKYLKNNFILFGIKKPQIKELSNELVLNSKNIEIVDLKDFISKLSKQKEREWIHVINLVLEKNLKRIANKEFILFINELISINSWWDSVDMYSATIISKLLLILSDSNFTETLIKSSNKNENIWYKRASLLYQLKFKNKTNFELQKQMILNVSEINSFWIQKAIGWTLREYFKTNSEEVLNFVEDNKEKLSKLATREALKNSIMN